VRLGSFLAWLTRFVLASVKSRGHGFTCPSCANHLFRASFSGSLGRLITMGSEGGGGPSVLSLLRFVSHGRIIYFEKIRVFKAGSLSRAFAYISME